MLNIIEIDNEFRSDIIDANKKIQALIVAGGLGTRIKTVNNELPKALISINGLPILYRQLKDLYNTNFNSIAISINKNDVAIFKRYLKDFDEVYYYIDLDIFLLIEDTRLGTLGILYSIKDCYKLMANNFLVMMGDLISYNFNYNYNKIKYINFTNDTNVVFCTKNTVDIYKSDLTNYSVFNTENKIVTYKGKYNKSIKVLSDNDYVGLGIYMFNKNILLDNNIISKYKTNKMVMVDDDVLPFCRLKLLNVGNSIFDVGIPNIFYKIQLELNKMEKKKSLGRTKMFPVVFLDRDGVINYKSSNRYINDSKELKVIPSSAIAIKKLNDAKIKVFVVTNQAGIEKGFLSENKLDEIHLEMNRQLADYGAHIDSLKYCKYSVSFRRKPNAGMILEAEYEDNIDVYNSFIIGDEVTDTQAGINAGINHNNIYQIESNSNINEIVDKIIVKYNCIKVAKLIIKSYFYNKIVLAAGNGGSNSDASHITTELLKSFIKSRYSKVNDKSFNNKIMVGIPIINLGDNASFLTAYSNDVDYNYAFAQLVNVYANTSNLFIGITTSGNSKNILNAIKMAKIAGLDTALITSDLAKQKEIINYADIVICSHKEKTYEIQEDHIKYYHYICKLVDEYLHDLQEAVENEYH